jgi:hypothetical protein
LHVLAVQKQQEHLLDFPTIPPKEDAEIHIWDSNSFHSTNNSNPSGSYAHTHCGDTRIQVPSCRLKEKRESKRNRCSTSKHLLQQMKQSLIASSAHVAVAVESQAQTLLLLGNF